MEREKQDRRTRKTRQLLRSTLLGLLKEKRYEDISVQDIIERADVARSTFYTHYVDKDDLLTGQHGVFAENLGEHIQAHSQREDDGSASSPGTMFSVRTWFYHVQAQGPILKLIAKDSALDLAMKTLHRIVQRSVEESLQAHLQAEKDIDIPASVLVDYVTGSLMILIQWWFKQGMTKTPEQMDALFQQLVIPGVSSVFHKTTNEIR